MLDVKLTEDQYLCLLDDLLLALTKETEQPLPENLTIKQKRWLIDGLLEVRAPGDIDESLLEMQDKVLSFENALRGTKTINQFKFVQGVANFDCDLSAVAADVCVLFSQALLCAPDEQSATERQILNFAGVQVKESLGQILQEYHNVVPSTKPYMVNAENLPCKKIAKILIETKNNVSYTDCVSFDLAVKDLAVQMQQSGFGSVAFDLKTLQQIEPALVEIVKRNFKLFKKSKIKILKNI